MGHMVTLLSDRQTVLQRGISLSFLTMVCRGPDVSTPLFKRVVFFIIAILDGAKWYRTWI